MAEEEEMEVLEGIPPRPEGVPVVGSLLTLFRLRLRSSLYVFSRDSYRFLSPNKKPRSGRSGW